MKLLISLFRKSPLNNKNKTLLICILTICVTSLIIISCKMHFQNNAAYPVHEESKWNLNPFSLLKNKASDEINKELKYLSILYLTKNNQTFHIIDLLKSSCKNISSNDKSSVLKWRLNILSPFGQNTAYLEFSNSNDNKGALANIDDDNILISFSYNSQKISSDLLNKICLAANDGLPSYIATSKTIVNNVKFLAKHIAPDCEFSASKDGWWCDISGIDPWLAQKELKKIRLTTIRSWSRQPYLLIRRLAITLKLAEALTSSNPNHNLDTLCNIMKNSAPIELPIAFSNNNFQNIVCAAEPQNPQRIQATKIGLAKAFDEIEFLRKLFERSSNLGILSLKIPRSKAPSKDFMVDLTPNADVSKLLAEKSKTLSGRLLDVPEGDFEQPKACWHVLFGYNKGLFNIAKYLDLIGEIENISCLSNISKTKNKKFINPQIYLADSITSETEFVITNWRSKLLRLPSGTYNYSIKPHSEKLGIEEADQTESDNVSTGTITWAKHRPNAIIRTW